LLVIVFVSRAVYGISLRIATPDTALRVPAVVARAARAAAPNAGATVVGPGT